MWRWVPFALFTHLNSKTRLKWPTSAPPVFLWGWCPNTCSLTRLIIFVSKSPKMPFSHECKWTAVCLHVTHPVSVYIRISRYKSQLDGNFKWLYCTLLWQGWKASWWSHCPKRQTEWQQWDRGWWSSATLFLWIIGRPAGRRNASTCRC